LEYIYDKIPTLKSEAAYFVQKAIANAETINKKNRNLIIDATKIRKAKGTK